MANGVSCLIFGVKNLEIAKSTKDPFRATISGIHAARVTDSVVNSQAVLKSGTGAKIAAKGGTKVLHKVCGIAKKLLYPLICLSASYRVSKSDDKVRTASKEATAITTMYFTEKLAESKPVQSFVKNVSTKLLKLISKNKKFIKGGNIIAQGLIYAGASIIGYDIGAGISNKTVDTIRNIKSKREETQKTQKYDEYMKAISNIGYETTKASQES